MPGLAWSAHRNSLVSLCPCMLISARTRSWPTKAVRMRHACRFAPAAADPSAARKGAARFAFAHGSSFAPREESRLFRDRATRLTPRHLPPPTDECRQRRSALRLCPTVALGTCAARGTSCAHPPLWRKLVVVRKSFIGWRLCATGARPVAVAFFSLACAVRCCGPSRRTRATGSLIRNRTAHKDRRSFCLRSLCSSHPLWFPSVATDY